MAESRLRTLSIDFAVQILNLVKFLKNQHETIVSNQIGRAGTSIGANIHEAQLKNYTILTPGLSSAALAKEEGRKLHPSSSAPQITP